MAKTNLTIRLLTSAVAVPLLAFLLFGAPAWGWALLIILGAGVSSFELWSMTSPTDRRSQLLGALLTGGVTLAITLVPGEPRAAVTALVFATLLSLLVPLFRLGDLKTAGLRLAGAAMAPLYVGCFLASLALLRRVPGQGFAGAAAGSWWVFLTLTLAWFGDTGGYFFGRFLGKTKLYPAVSPNKTRAGLYGAIFGSVLGAVLASQLYLRQLPLLHALVLGGVGGLLGQLGDLVESLFKRAVGVKDSGNVIPGHGGLLDRIDALLFVSPLVYLYTLWFQR